MRRPIQAIAVTLAALAILTGCLTQPPPDQSMLVLGDSITNLSRDHITGLRQGTDVVAVNGKTWGGMVQYAPSRHYDVAVVILGANDILSGNPADRAGMAALTDTINADCVVFVSTVHMPTNELEARWRLQRAVLGNFAADRDIPVWDGLANQWASSDVPLTMRDGVHPNERGRQVVARQALVAGTIC